MSSSQESWRAPWRSPCSCRPGGLRRRHRLGQLHPLRRLRRQPHRRLLSGSLYEAVQRNSYPALLYRQATGKTTGFEQPLVSAPGIPAPSRLTQPFPHGHRPQRRRRRADQPQPAAPLQQPGGPRRHAPRPGRPRCIDERRGPHDLILRKLGGTQLAAGALAAPDLRHAVDRQQRRPGAPPPPASPSRA